MGRLRGTVRQPGLVLCGLSLVLISLVAMPAPISAAAPADYAIPGGRFYTQAGEGKGGFGVRDLAGVRFWSEYARQGGPEALGYPISRPFWGPGGFLYQAFQRGLLQWRPEAGEAVLANNLEIIEAHHSTHNQWLFASYSIPYPRRPRAASFEDEAAERLSWLTNEQIRETFLTDPATGEPWDEEAAVRFYGLPQSEPRRAGPFIVQRFQRIPLQLWLDQVPGMPAPGSVVGVLGGELVRECGAVPRDATIPEPLVPPMAEVAGAATPPLPPQPSGATSPERYVVAPHDTLFSIAARVYGDGSTWPRLYEANHDQLASPNHIEAGMALRLPR